MINLRDTNALFVIVVIVVIFAVSCSKTPETPAAQSAAASPPSKPAAPGTVSGRAPAPQSGAAVIVVLDPVAPVEFPPQLETPVMDQVGQTFGPPVLLVRTGQPVEFHNSDDTLHNVHVNDEETREGAFNVAIPTGSSYTFKFPRDGFYHVGCDIHPAMAAEIVSTSTPYAALADADGRFAFENVAPGAYRLTVFANGKKSQRDVEVKGDAVTVDVSSGA
ncbi:MAG TPA: carboxypeptidase regulatory-like domain-containing protein [Thermoanaerobaculia bacterium]|nr:carboxypeptidase regulatory-like domain-containing protein [Thermoanaerobaculia bacterium]